MHVTLTRLHVTQADLHVTLAHLQATLAHLMCTCMRTIITTVTGPRKRQGTCARKSARSHGWKTPACTRPLTKPACSLFCTPARACLGSHQHVNDGVDIRGVLSMHVTDLRTTCVYDTTRVAVLLRLRMRLLPSLCWCEYPYFVCSSEYIDVQAYKNSLSHMPDAYVHSDANGPLAPIKSSCLIAAED